MAVTAIIFSLRSIRNETPTWKAYFIAGRVCAVVCWIMARSADAWLGGLLAVFFFSLMRNRLTANPFVIGLMLLCGGVAIEALSLGSEHVAALLGRNATFTGRTTVWILGRWMIHKHLLYGSGFATDAEVFGSFAKNSLFASAADLHSGYLDVLFNLGLVGAALMIVGVAGAMFRGYTYVLNHSGEERDQAIIFMSLIVGACACAAGEVSPFYFGGDGAVSLWTAVPALYQLGATWREQRLRAIIRAQNGGRFGVGGLQPQWRQSARPYATQVAELAPAGQGDAPA
jgi:O-antigen ligase